MPRQWILACSIAVFYPAALICAQSNTDSLGIEIAVARAMLRHQYTSGRVSIDPVEAGEHHAPSNPGAGKLRPDIRTKGIATAISAVVRPYSEVSACIAGQTKCALHGVSAHLVLSAPRIDGDTAMVTATIYQNTPSRRQPVDYETVILTVVRIPGTWSVVKEVQLGIS
jgi:hypothetical protein